MERREITAAKLASGAARGSDTKLQVAAKVAQQRHRALEALNRLLKIEVISASTIRLLSSPAYKCFMAEKILSNMMSRGSGHVAAKFNSAFFSMQFSKKLISHMYSGNDAR